ncbi:MAG: metallophosphoesterase [Christensenella sp.]|nr:metallophosphoesterase [Christensenella sp.]
MKNSEANMTKGKKDKTTLLLLLTLCALFLLVGFYNGLRIQAYDVDAKEIENHIKIALIADLHSCSYGEKERILANEITRQDPDLILFAGDIFDDEIPDDNTEYLLEKIAAAYPCYYVTGNHEYWSGSSAFDQKMRILKKYGVIRLSGTVRTITINGETLNIGGVDDPDSALLAPAGEQQNTQTVKEQVDRVKKLADNGNYTVLLSHRPELTALYDDPRIDLTVCGHAHGGQWRIPGLVNGIYAPNQGFFPKYAGGKYSMEHTTMIVSRGLARESIRIPRFYNRPEIVMINLH